MRFVYFITPEAMNYDHTKWKNEKVGRIYKALYEEASVLFNDERNVSYFMQGVEMAIHIKFYENASYIEACKDKCQFSTFYKRGYEKNF
jgi:hypothetical protein